MPSLYIVATPIGNLRDITLRALDTLKSVSVIYCEDTRHTAKLLAAHGIATRCQAYHEHNGEQVRPQILQKLAEGKDIALVSDAGTPLISDPGFKLVREVREVGYAVVPIPGVSAVITALCASGLPTDQFHFCGFLPPKSSARSERFTALKNIPGTLVFYESPRRVAAFLQDAMNVLGGTREAIIARELTKTYEEFRQGQLSELSDYYQQSGDPKGEVVILIAPDTQSPAAISEAEISQLIAQALQQHPVKQAAEMISQATGMSKREVYQLALQFKNTQ